jgi:hypothetical protein
VSLHFIAISLPTNHIFPIFNQDMNYLASHVAGLSTAASLAGRFDLSERRSRWCWFGAALCVMDRRSGWIGTIRYPLPHITCTHSCWNDGRPSFWPGTRRLSGLSLGWGCGVSDTGTGGGNEKRKIFDRDKTMFPFRFGDSWIISWFIPTFATSSRSEPPNNRATPEE